MPAAGTKKIEIDGQVKFLPAEDVEFARLVAKGYALDRALQSLKADLAAVKLQLVELLEPHRGARRSLRQQGPQGWGVHVKWESETSVDPDAAEKAQVVIAEADAEVAAGLFTRVISWKLGPGWNAFVKGEQKPTIEKLKPLAIAAVRSQPQKPRVSFFDDAFERARVASEGES